MGSDSFGLEDELYVSGNTKVLITKTGPTSEQIEAERRGGWYLVSVVYGLGFFRSYFQKRHSFSFR